MVALWLTAVATTETGKLPDSEPAGIVILPGIVKLVEFRERPTTAPFEGAAAVNVTVQYVDAPALTVAGLQLVLLTAGKDCAIRTAADPTRSWSRMSSESKRM